MCVCSLLFKIQLDPHTHTVAFNSGNGGPDVPLPTWPPSSPHIPGKLADNYIHTGAIATEY